MKNDELMQIMGTLAVSTNETRQGLADILGYTDRELAALVAGLAEVKALAEQNGDYLAQLDEAKVIAMAQTLAKELADLGIDGEKLSDLLEKIRSNELKLATALTKLEALEQRAASADADRASIKGTQADHAGRITKLEQREDKVGQSEEEVNAQIGGALQELANGISALALNYTAPVTGLDYPKSGFKRMPGMSEPDTAEDTGGIG